MIIEFLTTATEHIQPGTNNRLTGREVGDVDGRRLRTDSTQTCGRRDEPMDDLPTVQPDRLQEQHGMERRIEHTEACSRITSNSGSWPNYLTHPSVSIGTAICSVKIEAESFDDLEWPLFFSEVLVTLESRLNEACNRITSNTGSLPKYLTHPSVSTGTAIRWAKIEAEHFNDLERYLFFSEVLVTLWPRLIRMIEHGNNKTAFRVINHYCEIQRQWMPWEKTFAKFYGDLLDEATEEYVIRVVGYKDAKKILRHCRRKRNKKDKSWTNVRGRADRKPSVSVLLDRFLESNRPFTGRTPRILPDLRISKT